ncbi:MAG: PH domain-containing protein [Lachnospiraceae bacterium]|nr:PH domain-containing protein [Lachnospiraceae bacterium]
MCEALEGQTFPKVIAIVVCVLLLVKDVYISALVGSESIKSNSKYKWHDRKRIAFFGLPWTFTRYYLTNEKLVMVKGLFNTREDEVKLYRVTDFALTRKFWQKLFGLGTLEVKSSDKTCPSLNLVNIKKSGAVKELISKLVEEERDRKRVTGREIINNHDHECPDDYDDNDDTFESTGDMY